MKISASLSSGRIGGESDPLRREHGGREDLRKRPIVREGVLMMDDRIKDFTCNRPHWHVCIDDFYPATESNWTHHIVSSLQIQYESCASLLHFPSSL